MNWRRLCYEQLDRLTPDERGQIIVARRGDGKCTVGHIKTTNQRSVTIQNGDHQTNIWFSEPRMFCMLPSPGFPEMTVGERKLPFE